MGQYAEPPIVVPGLFLAELEQEMLQNRLGHENNSVNPNELLHVLSEVLLTRGSLEGFFDVLVEVGDCELLYFGIGGGIFDVIEDFEEILRLSLLFESSLEGAKEQVLS